MPGILPMKVIKVGSTSQSRIAQACDRCRSKKIRCDGVRPTCSQCAGVGFECRTTDKLSRRAFPRGYTESLEERVRALESEVRQLKDVLDEKDEQVDILSKLRAHVVPAAPPGPAGDLHAPAGSRSHAPDGRRSTVVGGLGGGEDPGADDVVAVSEAPGRLSGVPSHPHFAGASSGWALVDLVRRKLQTSGRGDWDVSADARSVDPSLAPTSSSSPVPSPKTRPPANGPARLVSDQLIHLYFHEWAPLFPVLHRPTFLAWYDTFCAAPDPHQDPRMLAQLYLVFGVAAAASGESLRQEVHDYEACWQKTLDGPGFDASMVTLQNLLLAQMFYLSTDDHERLHRYRGLAVGLAHCLGLHQPQRRFSLDALTTETRRRVSWCLYTLDCFGAAELGLPRLLKDGDIQTEDPADMDDVGDDQGCQSPTREGSTRLSATLALIQASRILSSVLEKLYPPGASSYTISQRDQRALEQRLRDWLDALPSPLKLRFAPGQSAPTVVESSSPILALLYHYIRSLIHRPSLGSTNKSASSTSVVAVVDSARHILQILQLLDERKMNFAFCMKKDELLLTSGLAVIFQVLDWDSEGMMTKEGERLVSTALGMMEPQSSAGATLRHIASSVMPAEGTTGDLAPSGPMAPPTSSTGSRSAPRTLKSAHERLRSFTSRFYPSHPHPGASSTEVKARRSTMPTSFPSTGPPAVHAHPGIFSTRMPSTPALLPDRPPTHRLPLDPGVFPPMPPPADPSTELPHLEYFSFSAEPLRIDPENSSKIASGFDEHVHLPMAVGDEPREWERTRSSLDVTRSSIYHGFPGGLSVDPGLTPTSLSILATPSGWASEVWSRGGLQPLPPGLPGPTYSPSSVTSAGDGSSSAPHDPYRGLILPHSTGEEGFEFDALERHLGR